jgi:hypothetical protein
LTNQEKTSQRQELVDALKQAGMEAAEFTAPDGKTYVVQPLLDTRVEPMINAARKPELRSYFNKAVRSWHYPAYLFICSGSTSPPWSVGVIGHDGRTDDDYTPDEWAEAETTDEAVEQFRRLWNNRDSLLNAFIGDLTR